MVFENPPEGIEFRESVSPVIGSSDSFDNFSAIPASSNEFFKVSPSIFSLAKSSSISDLSKPVPPVRLNENFEKLAGEPS